VVINSLDSEGPVITLDAENLEANSSSSFIVSGSVEDASDLNSLTLILENSVQTFQELEVPVWPINLRVQVSDVVNNITNKTIPVMVN